MRLRKNVVLGIIQGMRISLTLKNKKKNTTHKGVVGDERKIIIAFNYDFCQL